MSAGFHCPGCLGRNRSLTSSKVSSIPLLLPGSPTIAVEAARLPVCSSMSLGSRFPTASAKALELL
jgi:hypothetical protein